jgi:ring-1,2-phenylacetyl-CoA epoxidase subunit PaaD
MGARPVLASDVDRCDDSVMRAVASVRDPELPVLTLADLGVLRDVRVDGDAVSVTITPTYTGCPALAEMRADLRRALADAGYSRVEVHTALSPPWTTDWITEDGRRKLAEAGIAPPAVQGPRPAGPIPLTLDPPPGTPAASAELEPAVFAGVRCPRCGEPATEELSRFGPTPCTALRRCPSCREPFEQMKAV